MTSVESPLERLAGLNPVERETVLKVFAAERGITVDELKATMLNSWRFTGRPKQQAPPGDWLFWWIRAGRGFGKLLADDTPLPTPSGWTTMGQVQEGDVLFDETGALTKVTWKSYLSIVPAYRVRFSDGTSLLACADHQWVTWDHPARKAYLRSVYEDPTKMPSDWPEWRVRRARRRDRDPVRFENGQGPRVRTTREIADSLRQGARGDLNHSIPLAEALLLPAIDLPIDPYVLGYWLGDGTTVSGQFTIHPDDQGSFFVHAKQFSPRRLKHPNNVGTSGLGHALRQQGLLGNKHVPEAYLRASSAQRLALLQGLMDSDGHAMAQTSHVEFTSVTPDLAAAVMELATSLGQKPSLTDGPSFLNGREYQRRYRVTWRPTIQVFRLPRKAQRISWPGAQAFRSLNRMVTAVEPTGVNVPMHCIAVDSPHRMYLAGEGMIPTHNTLSAAHWTKDRGLERRCRIGVIAPTLGDVRSTCFEGITGLLAVIPNDALLGQTRSIGWNKSLLELTLANGTVIKGFSSEEPDRLRGPQHDYVWGEEFSSWRDAGKGDALDTTFSNMKLGLRNGPKPQAVLTSTPKANKLTKELASMTDDLMVMVLGSSYENRSNLSEQWWRAVVAPLEGTRTGRQEIEAEILEDVEGALWTRTMIDKLRVPVAPPLQRIVVAVDPNTTSGESADDAGIVIAGLGHSDKHGYVLADHTQTRGGPRAWAQAAVDAYYEFEADLIVVEVNNGGEMCELVIHSVDPTVPVKKITASRGKRTRAEPVAALYEADEEREKVGRVHHVGPAVDFAPLEDELTTWTAADASPNRLDALVWALTELKLWAAPPVPMRTYVPGRGRDGAEVNIAPDRFGGHDGMFNDTRV